MNNAIENAIHKDNPIAYYKQQVAYIYYHFVNPKGERDIKNCALLYDELLCSLTYTLDTLIMQNFRSNDNDLCADIFEYIHILKLLYKLIAQTRDICNGKGERDITYMMIYKWWKYFPNMGLIILYAILFSGDNHTYIGNGFKLYIDTKLPYFPHSNSYGCLKDIKYFCNYVYLYGSKKDAICKYAMVMLNQRIYNDYMEYKQNGTLPSIACKWVPRENSKYGWMFEKMAIQWIQATEPYILSGIHIDGIDINDYDHTEISLVGVKAITKCKTIYRKVISILTKMIDITETKQCENRWGEIDPAKITISNLAYNKNAFFNIDNTFQERHHTVVHKDRRECSHNIKEHMFIAQMSPDITLNHFIKSYTNRFSFSPMQFVKQAIHIIQNKKMEHSPEMQENILYQTNVLNNTWKKFSKKCNTLENFIPILDASLSMRGDSLYNAIGMCCLISEKSKIGQRVMVMDNIPTWVNLEGCADHFVEMVEVLYSYTNKHTIANIVRTFDGLIQAITMSSSPQPTQSIGSNKLVFVIFTNEHSFWKYENDMLHPVIIDMFIKANLSIPHIVYWNCSPHSKDNHHHISDSTNIKRMSMLSGTNAELLNHFSFIGWGELYNCDSFETVENILASSRYYEIDKLFDIYWTYPGTAIGDANR